MVLFNLTSWIALMWSYVTVRSWRDRGVSVPLGREFEGAEAPAGLQTEEIPPQIACADSPCALLIF